MTYDVPFRVHDAQTKPAIDLCRYSTPSDHALWEDMKSSSTANLLDCIELRVRAIKRKNSHTEQSRKVRASKYHVMFGHTQHMYVFSRYSRESSDFDDCLCFKTRPSAGQG